MTKEETIQVLQSIEDRAINFPCMTACDWVAIASAKRHLTNSVEVKEVDLEEKATQLSQKYFPNEENIWARANIEAQDCKNACIEMAKWQKQQDQATIELAEDHSMLAGMEKMKNEMMAKAIDAEVLENYDGKVIKYDETILDEKLSDCKVFDKVKVIVIKED